MRSNYAAKCSPTRTRRQKISPVMPRQKKWLNFKNAQKYQWRSGVAQKTYFILRWLNTVLGTVSGNSRDGAYFKLDREQTWRRKSNVHRTRFLKIYSLKFCDIWQNLYFYRILIDENFKMEVEQTNFLTDLIITEQLYHWLSKNPSVKIWSNKFLMVMINYSKLCASL